MVYRLFYVQLVLRYTADASSQDYNARFRKLIILKIMTAALVCSVRDTCKLVLLSVRICGSFS
jgi:hypothetical protein